MNSFIDSQKLRSAGHAVKVPFHLNINCDGRVSELQCTDVLRALPKKRLVCNGHWEGRQVVAKFFLDSRSAVRHCYREEKGIAAVLEEIKTILAGLDLS